MSLVYNILIRLYVSAIRFTGLWNKKANEWHQGRKDLFLSLEQKIHNQDKIIWMHCSSAGEFEQAKPIIEHLKQDFPFYKILISFFSPSGYEVAKNYTYADFITYLPLDTKQNARRFIELVNPRLIIFIKYEFWYHHLSVAATKHIPILLVSAVFRKDQIFFKGYGGFYKQMLFLFRHIFVQDEASLKLLNEIHINQCSISGDTRFDRVVKIADSFTEIPLIKDFIQNKNVVVAGSTWGDDEKILSAISGLKLILAPHQINEIHLLEIEKLFPKSIRYSALKKLPASFAEVLIIDNVGMLAKLYQYATIAYVGGGFTKDGIHNILEAAVYGKPVILGPVYKKYREATELIACGGAFSIVAADELEKKINTLLTDKKEYEKASHRAQDYVFKNTGATNKVVTYIQENRLLTI